MMAREFTPGRQASTDDNELPAGPPEAGQSSAALQTPVASASSLASAHGAVPEISQAEGAGALDVPSFAIPDADIVNMLEAPQLDYLNPHYLGSPMWNLPFFFVSSPQPLTSLAAGALDTSQTFPGFAYDNTALGEYLSGVDEPDGANLLVLKCSRARDGRSTPS